VPPAPSQQPCHGPAQAASSKHRQQADTAGSSSRRNQQAMTERAITFQDTPALTTSTIFTQGRLQ
jgi:hypothetical protein